MTRFAVAFVAASLSLGALIGPAAAQSVEDAAGIEAAIHAQIQAMRADDWAGAFAYASPAIQGLFRDPESFSRMVTTGYPMVWRPRNFTTGALTQTPRGLQQTMLFEDRQGRLFIADYLMQLVDGAWRINGVTIRPAPAESV